MGTLVGSAMGHFGRDAVSRMMPRQRKKAHRKARHVSSADHDTTAPPLVHARHAAVCQAIFHRPPCLLASRRLLARTPELLLDRSGMPFSAPFASGLWLWIAIVLFTVIMDGKKQHFGRGGSPPPCEPLPPKTFYRPGNQLDGVSTLGSTGIRDWTDPPPVDHHIYLYGYSCLQQVPLPPGPPLPLPSNIASDTQVVHNAGAEAVKQSRGARRKRLLLHCGRLWPCYVIALIVLGAIFLPLL